MIIRFLKEEGIDNKIAELRTYTNKKYPTLYGELFDNYIEEEEEAYIKEKEVYYPLSVKLPSGDYFSVLFLSFENIRKIINYSEGSLMNQLKLIPFASIGTTLYYCFDYSLEGEPEIVLYNPNKSKFKSEITSDDLKIHSKEEWEYLGVKKVFSSFTEFMDNLCFNPRDKEEEEYTSVEDFYDLYDNWKDFYYKSSS